MELATLAQAAWRQPVAEGRLSGDRFVVGLRTLLPLLEAAGASPELLRALRLRPAGELATVILPAGSGQGRVDLGNRDVVIPAALRDAIRAAFERALAQNGPRATQAAPQAASGAPPEALSGAATVRLLDASAQAAAPVALRAADPAHAARESVRQERAARRTPHAIALEPLLDPADDAAAAAVRLRAAVERSGLFFESHLAARVRGGDENVMAELRQAPPPSPERTAAQLDVLAQDALWLQVCAWAGQQARLELRRDDEAAPGAAGEGNVFSARLNLDLPRLGPLEVQLRLTGHAVAVSLACAAREAIEAHLPQLAAQLERRGLQPVALQATAAS